MVQSKNQNGAVATRSSDGSPQQLPDTLLGVLNEWRGVLFEQDADLRFTWCSEGLRSLTGLAPEGWLRNPAVFEVLRHSEDAAAYDRHLAACSHPPYRSRVRFRLLHPQNKQLLWIEELRVASRDAAQQVCGYTGIWTEVTPLITAQQRLAEAAWQETLASVGMGMAHDFNNFLTGVLPVSEQLHAQLAPGHLLAPALALVLENARATAAYLRDLAQLFQAPQGSKTLVDLNSAVVESRLLLRHSISRRYDLVTALADAPLPVLVEMVALRRVLVMLVMYCLQNMAQATTLTLFTADTAPAWEEALWNTGPLPGGPGAVFGVRNAGPPWPAFAESQMDALARWNLDSSKSLALLGAQDFARRHGAALAWNHSAATGNQLRLWLPRVDLDAPGSSA